MPSSLTFFGKIKTRFNQSQKNRSESATYLYNHYGEPNTTLRKTEAYWFKPMERAKFKAFDDYSDFSDDLTSLLLKPVIFMILGAYEVLNRILCIPAALAQVVNLNLPGFFHKVLDFCETLLFAAICETWAAIEFVLQVGSLAMRLGCTVLGAFGWHPGAEEMNDLNPRDETHQLTSLSTT
jgi:hypothetical protein